MRGEEEGDIPSLAVAGVDVGHMNGNEEHSRIVGQDFLSAVAVVQI